jgi:putative tricarboxylic transport membrane protein
MKRKLVFGTLAVAVTLLASLSAGQAGRKIRIMVPCTPGCSWEVMAQQMARIMKDEGLADSVEVYSVTGNGIPAALQKFTEQKGNPNELMAFGVGVIGATVLANAPVQIGDFTPVARMVSEYETIFVASNSPYQSLADLVKAWRANPQSIAWGGTSKGSTAHLVSGLLARAAGIDPTKIKFVPSNGNLQGARAMINGELEVVSASYAAVEALVTSNQIRPLAISAPKRVVGLGIPTFTEQGFKVQFQNWRGVVAPPGISDRQRAAWQGLMSRLDRNSIWRSNAEANNWQPYFQTGTSFQNFLADQQGSVTTLLQSLGLLK